MRWNGYTGAHLVSLATWFALMQSGCLAEREGTAALEARLLDAHDSQVALQDTVSSDAASPDTSSPDTTHDEDGASLVDVADAADVGASICPSSCSDGVPCTTDTCNTSTGACVHTPDHDECSDGNPCTTNTCALGKGCQWSPRSGNCGLGQACSDGVCVQSSFVLNGDFVSTPSPAAGGYRLIEGRWLSVQTCSQTHCLEGRFVQ